MPRTGAVANNAGSNTDERQMASIGATRGPDGWWYKDGRRLSHNEADQLVRAAGTAESGQADWGSGRGTAAEMYGRNRGWLAPALTIGAGLINPALGAVVSGLTNYERNHNVGQALGSAGTAYALGNVAGRIPGVGAVRGSGAGRAVSDAIGSIPGAASVGAMLNGRGGSAGGSGGAPQSVGGMLGAAGDFLTGNGGLNALGLAQGANAAMLGQKAGNFADMAAKNVDENWQSRAPLRVAGMEGMLRPQIADTSALRRISARSNPFADRPQPASGGR